MRLIVGITGASGMIYGIRLLEILATIKDIETHLILSPTARMNIALETDWAIKDVETLADVIYKINDVGAAIASGSFKTAGMIIAPCSIKTLSGVVNSYADNLIVRAADVVLKEHRRLVLMPRETPLHTGHLRLMHEASLMGAIIAPPMPAMYTKPETIDDIVDQSVGRVLDLFDIDSGVVKRWTGNPK